MAKKGKARKWHKWFGLSLSLFIVLFTISGIILNHRSLFSGIDVDRNYLPEDLQYNNWNLASVKSTLKLNEDSILVYGNIGVFLSNSDMTVLKDLNKGFDTGVDNRKIEVIHKTKDGKILASTLFGIYELNLHSGVWEDLNFPYEHQRIVDICENKTELILLSRSKIFRTKDFKNYSEEILPSYEGYDNKVSLFKTIWLIHSGEIYGEVGKLIVDFVGLIFSILVISGIIYFTFPSRIRRRKKENKESGGAARRPLSVICRAHRRQIP